MTSTINEPLSEPIIGADCAQPKEPCTVVPERDGDERALKRHRRAGPAKSFCFTWNNPGEDAEGYLRSLAGVSRMVVGAESAPTTGTRHFQGFVTFRSARRLQSLIKCTRNAVHWEVAGRSDLSEDYARKDGSIVIDIDHRATRGANRETASLPEFIAAVQSGTDDMELIGQFPKLYARYYKLVDRMRLVFAPRGRDPPDVHWYYGGTGTGKTREVHEREGEALYTHGGNFKWFDGYTGQEAVLFDDFRSDQVEFAVLLRLLDRYPLRVEVKGGSMMFYPKRIYITTQESPDEMFGTSVNEDIEQLKRRITHVRRFDRV